MQGLLSGRHEILRAAGGLHIKTRFVPAALCPAPRCSQEPAAQCPGWRVTLRQLRPSWSVQCPGGPASSPSPPTRRPTSRTGGCRISPPASRLWTPWGEAPGGGAVLELVGSALCGPNSFIFFLIYNFFGGIADIQCCVQQSESVVRIRISTLF